MGSSRSRKLNRFIQNTSENHCLIRKPESLELLASCNSLVCDVLAFQTGKIRVEEAWLAGTYEEGSCFPTGGAISQQLASLITVGISTNTTTDVEKVEGESDRILGDYFEGALLVYLRDVLQCDYSKIRQVFGFGDSILKHFWRDEILEGVSTVARLSGNESLARLYCHGGAGYVLSKCTQVLRSDDTVVVMEESEKESLFSLCDQMGSRGLTTLGLAFRDIVVAEEDVTSSQRHEADRDLVLYGILALRNPLRPESPAIVKEWQDADTPLVVRFATMESLSTATAVARDCGMIVSENKNVAMRASEYLNLSEEDRNAAAKQLRVLAEASDRVKLDFVKRLKEVGVAFVGSKSNDGAVMNQATVGIAMGLTGCSVVKASSGMILLEDNMDSVYQGWKLWQEE